MHPEHAINVAKEKKTRLAINDTLLLIDHSTIPHLNYLIVYLMYVKHFFKIYMYWHQYLKLKYYVESM